MKENAGTIMTLVFLGVLAVSVLALVLRKLMWARLERAAGSKPQARRPGPPRVEE